MSDDPTIPLAWIRAFVARVNARAEADMLSGRPVTGAHHRALEAERIAAETAEAPRDEPYDHLTGDPVYDALSEIRQIAVTLLPGLSGVHAIIDRCDAALAAYAYIAGVKAGEILRLQEERNAAEAAYQSCQREYFQRRREWAEEVARLNPPT